MARVKGALRLRDPIMTMSALTRRAAFAALGAMALAAVAASGALAPTTSYDNTEGVATIDSVDMPVRATSTYYPMASDDTMIEQSNRDRISQMTEALAYWIAQDAAGIASAGPRV